jgi:hypothetical protein
MLELNQPAAVVPAGASDKLQRPAGQGLVWSRWKDPSEVLVTEIDDGSQVHISADAAGVNALKARHRLRKLGAQAT